MSALGFFQQIDLATEAVYFRNFLGLVGTYAIDKTCIAIGKGVSDARQDPVMLIANIARKAMILTFSSGFKIGDSVKAAILTQGLETTLKNMANDCLRDFVEKCFPSLEPYIEPIQYFNEGVVVTVTAAVATKVFKKT